MSIGNNNGVSDDIYRGNSYDADVVSINTGSLVVAVVRGSVTLQNRIMNFSTQFNLAIDQFTGVSDIAIGCSILCHTVLVMRRIAQSATAQAVPFVKNIHHISILGGTAFGIFCFGAVPLMWFLRWGNGS